MNTTQLKHVSENNTQLVIKLKLCCLICKNTFSTNITHFLINKIK